jgi:tRNA threonylcarbamoyladenosine dehydratase
LGKSWERLEAMASWISRTVHSHQAQLIITGCVSAAVGASLLLGFQATWRRYQREELEASIPDISQEHVATRLTEYGAAADSSLPNKEDERGSALANRARLGDYDDGGTLCIF